MNSSHNQDVSRDKFLFTMLALFKQLKVKKKAPGKRPWLQSWLCEG